MGPRFEKLSLFRLENIVIQHVQVRIIRWIRIIAIIFVAIAITIVGLSVATPATHDGMGVGTNSVLVTVIDLYETTVCCRHDGCTGKTLQNGLLKTWAFVEAFDIFRRGKGGQARRIGFYRVCVEISRLDCARKQT